MQLSVGGFHLRNQETAKRKEIHKVDLLPRTCFTLIELMITVSIVAILAVIAIPAYQDYVARAQTGEGFSLATAAKEAITDSYGAHGAFPDGNSDAGPGFADFHSRQVR